MKRSLAFTVSVFMLLAMCCLTASAEKTVCYIVRNGVEVKYNTVQLAVDAAVSGETVVMTANSTESKIIKFGTKSITIDGGGFEIDSTGVTGGYQFMNSRGNGTQTVVIKNAVLTHDNGFWLYPMNLSIEDCIVNTNNGNALYFYTQSNVSHNVQLTKCEWYVNKNGGDNAFAKIGTGSMDDNGTLTINDTLVDYHQGSSGKEKSSMFDCNSRGQIALNILGNTELRMTGDLGGPLFYSHSDGSNKINMDNGVKITFKSDADISSFTNDENLRVVDNGVIWRVERSTSEASIIKLPVTDTVSVQWIGRSHEGKLYSPSCREIVVEETSTIAPVFVNTDDIKMVDGADLSYGDDETGLRFTTLVSETLYDKIGDNVTFGTIVVPLAEDEISPVYDTANEKLYIDQTKWDMEYSYGYRAFHGTVIMNPEGIAQKAVYEMRLSAVGYFTVSYEDGGKYTIYADFDKDKNTSSMLDVAYKLEYSENGIAKESNALTRHILEVCGINDLSNGGNG